MAFHHKEGGSSAVICR